jgi:hypothetical protein
MIRSSYKNTIDYSDIFSSICFMKKPQKIIEIGILDGYSLLSMVNNVDSSCNINAYDIFEEFNGNSANKEKLDNIFSKYENVSIEYGDFYKLHYSIDDNSLDILHIDIANNGNIYQFTFDNYMKKLKKDGLLIIEGGSNERDDIEWMNKYNFPKINPIINNYKNLYNIHTIGTIPSITLISHI